MTAKKLYEEFCLDNPLVRGVKGIVYTNWLEKRIIKLESQKYNVLDKIIQIICTNNDISIELFLSNKRDRYLSEARAAYCIIARKTTSKTTNQIGKKINRDHATVIYHLNNSSQHLSVIGLVDEAMKVYPQNIKKKVNKKYRELTEGQKTLIRVKLR